MQGALVTLIAIVAFVIALNFMMLFFRLRRDRYRKPSKEVIEEEKAVVWRDKEIRRRLDREQEEAIRYVELRNQTLALYEECRRRAAALENGTDGSSEPVEEQMKPVTESTEPDAERPEPDTEHLDMELPGLWTGSWGHEEGD